MCDHCAALEGFSTLAHDRLKFQTPRLKRIFYASSYPIEHTDDVLSPFLWNNERSNNLEGDSIACYVAPATGGATLPANRGALHGLASALTLFITRDTEYFVLSRPEIPMMSTRADGDISVVAMLWAVSMTLSPLCESDRSSSSAWKHELPYHRKETTSLSTCLVPEMSLPRLGGSFQPNCDVRRFSHCCTTPDWLLSHQILIMAEVFWRFRSLKTPPRSIFLAYHVWDLEGQ